MPLFASEAKQIAQEANGHLLGAFIQRLSAPTHKEAFLELRMSRSSCLLVLSADTQTGRLSISNLRPNAPTQPQSIQQAMRKHLMGARFLEARVQTGLWLLWQNRQRRFWLWANWKQGYLALGEEAGPWLSFSSRPRDGLTSGMPCLPPFEFEVDSKPSRLVLVADMELPALHAAATFFKTQEAQAATKRLKTQLVRLQKTMAKVQAETCRMPHIERLQAEGEALAQNLSNLKRGATSVSLECFHPDGTLQTHLVKLNPAKTPKEEMEARFHQAKRLRRGIEIAKARLLQLEAEAQTLRKQIEDSERGPSTEEEVRAPPLAAKAKPERSQPYREYVSADGQNIWVGRGAKHNEVLSFQLAMPWHLWLHARGQSGAHVLVPLNRNEEAKPETLIDAAHLAWHYSNGRKEPLGEVSYVQARYLRKPKGQVGAVLLTREKTLHLRIEEARLNRLLRRPTPSSTGE
ncbi:MAG: NFACT RNA binding domain-containing protein [Proteobacteria bacterium]|nr:NFACT RNA binding domain-containing protein [Cystobacterineae bacterium]MCL2313689.1 NFACT RNA binding domain-containing protein [Pseudomonadota bacterium]